MKVLAQKMAGVHDTPVAATWRRDTWNIFLNLVEMYVIPARACRVLREEMLRQLREGQL